MIITFQSIPKCKYVVGMHTKVEYVRTTAFWRKQTTLKQRKRNDNINTW